MKMYENLHFQSFLLVQKYRADKWTVQKSTTKVPTSEKVPKSTPQKVYQDVPSLLNLGKQN